MGDTAQWLPEASGKAQRPASSPWGLPVLREAELSPRCINALLLPHRTAQRGNGGAESCEFVPKASQ